jgi:eukaryotic-like serine/threonine-protein kinase
MDRPENFTGGSLSQQITRDYHIIRLLGKGGMGEVYLAEQLRVGRRLVALKVLNRACCENPDLMRRFENEAASGGRIHHRNVVMVYESRVTDDGQLYVAMEYVEGPDLGHAIEQRGSLPLDEVVEITKQIAAGLGAAHKLGIVHRDVKPGNIMLSRDDEGALVVKVLDFGIARLSEPGSGGAQTKTGVVMGTPDYMSPEQTLGQTGDKIDSRSDIYSLAMVVNKMLTGRVAFEGDSWVQVMYKNINEAPPPPSQMRPELAHIGPIDQVVLKGLEKDREKRQQSATMFANELEAAYTRVKPRNPQEVNTVLYPGSGGETGMPFVPATTVQATEDTPYPSTLVTKPIQPNTHEIEVTDTAIAFKNENVTIADKDAASLETVAMVEPPGPAAAGAGARRLVTATRAGGSKSPAAKRIAMVVSAVILLGLAAAAFLVFRGPGKPSQQLASDSSAHAVPATTPSQASTSEQAAKSVVASPTPSVASKVNKSAASLVEPTKRETSAKQESTSKVGNPPNASSVPPAAAPAEETNNERGACLGVFVTRSGGDAVRGARVSVIDEPSGQYLGKTGPKGVWRRCGLTPGHKVSVTVFGPGGAVIGSKEFLLKAGGNPFRVQVR